MRISDWSSDVCSSDLTLGWTMVDPTTLPPSSLLLAYWTGGAFLMGAKRLSEYRDISTEAGMQMLHRYRRSFSAYTAESLTVCCLLYARSEEHTSELQSLMRISYAVFCLKKKTTHTNYI